MDWSRTYSGAEPIRINKWLAQEGVCSRREADALIANGLILLDGEKVTVAGERVAPGQTVSLSGAASRRLDNQLSIVLNKPTGYVSGTPEPGEIPAIRLVRAETLSGSATVIPGRSNRMAPLGRLDKDSRGLLILSEDGVLARAVIGPLTQMDKEYLVRVTGDITEARLELLRHGLELDGRRLRPAQVSREKGPLLRFILQEGRKRQIRRMCELVGLRVTDLQRIRIGPVVLSGLKEGQWRPLSARERAALLAASGGEAGPVLEEETPPVREASGGAKRVRASGPPKPDRPARKPDLKGAAFRRTKLAPRRRSPIK